MGHLLCLSSDDADCLFPTTRECQFLRLLLVFNWYSRAIGSKQYELLIDTHASVIHGDPPKLGTNFENREDSPIRLALPCMTSVRELEWMAIYLIV